MYENGNAQLIEILFESENIGDFLNKAEYISAISAYDRDMLKVFQEVTQEVKEQEEVIRAEYEDMEEMQNQLITKQDELKAMVEDKADEIAELESAIKKNAKKLEKLQKAAEDALRKQQESANNPGNAGASVVAGSGYFTHPCPGYSRISSSFGWREQPLPGASTNHKGVDYAAPTGTPIYAAAAGTVTFAAYSGNAGKLIVINHGDGKVTKYMHCNALYVNAGQKVSKGQNIAAVGSTGNSTGPHLHLEVRLNGVALNPQNYVY
jgi:murein DD-endopeptidase MepM/ murein hydrolase activator NlpD